MPRSATRNESLPIDVTYEPLAKWLFIVILNEVKDINLMKILDFSLRSE
jgi:hypothetical protein